MMRQSRRKYIGLSSHEKGGHGQRYRWCGSVDSQQQRESGKGKAQLVCLDYGAFRGRLRVVTCTTPKVQITGETPSKKCPSNATSPRSGLVSSLIRVDVLSERRSLSRGDIST